MKRSLQVRGVEQTESSDECDRSAADSKEHSSLNSHRSQTRHLLTVTWQQLVRPGTHCVRHQPQYMLVIGYQ